MEEKRQNTALMFQMVFQQFYSNLCPDNLRSHYAEYQKTSEWMSKDENLVLEKDARNHLRIKNVLTSTAPMLIDKSQDTAKSLILDFLRET